jgi:Zn-dependent protease with chaperone function
MILPLLASLAMYVPSYERIEEAAWQEAAKAQATTESKQTKEEKKHQEELKNDAEIGKKYAVDAEKEFKASTNKEYIDRVNRIGAEMAAIANANQVKVSWGDSRVNSYNYTFKVVQNPRDADSVNAFSLPGGYIFVFDGLVKYVESDDELAGVIAHEISHAKFRHVATLEHEMNKLQMLTLPAILIALFSGGKAGADVGILAQLTQQSSGSGWSQKAELAADYGGFQLEQKSKYSPVGMLTFMERLARDQKSVEAIDWGIYRTHPPSRERAEALTGYLTTAQIPIRRSLVSTSSRASLRTNSDGTVDTLFGGKQIFRFGGALASARAKDAVGRLNEFFDSVPELYQVTFTADGTIRGKNDVLFRITSDDAAATNKPVEELSTEAVKAIKRSMFLLAYRVWDVR